MFRFENDYSEGAHPSILSLLEETNDQQSAGYGCDEWCDKAREAIRNACKAPQAAVEFAVGGTQANLMVIDILLRPYEGVLAAETGHIQVHETGAVEATGHKVLTLKETEGKISAQQVGAYMAEYCAQAHPEHVVQPGMVYISQPTEYGTLYTKEELQSLYEVCGQYQLPLFVDGARLAYALACESNDVSLSELASLCDVFYIGGTKCGAFFGEAVVFVNEALAKGFRHVLKQRGALLAKGRLLGLQFYGLFQNNLYYNIGETANKQADRIRNALLQSGFELIYGNRTNQIFFLGTDAAVEQLEKNFVLSDNGRMKGMRCMRICTSWATREEAVDQLVDAILKR